MELSARGSVGLVGGVGFVVAGRILGEPAFFGLAAAIFLLLGVAAYSVARRAPPLGLRTLPGCRSVQVGGQALLGATVTNGGIDRSSRAILELGIEAPGGAIRQVEILVPPIAPYGTGQATVTLPTDRRGSVRVVSAGFCYEDPLGLLRRRVEPVACSGATARSLLHPPSLRAGQGLATLTVTPEIESLACLGRGGLPGEGERAAMANTAGGGLSCLRPYVVGDDLRRVHWPTSARAGELIVCDRDEPEPCVAETTIVLDTCASNWGPRASRSRHGVDLPGRRSRDLEEPVPVCPAFERAVSIAASFVCGSRGDLLPLRLLTSAGEASRLVTSMAGRQSLLEALSLVEPSRAGGLDRALRTLARSAQQQRVVLITSAALSLADVAAVREASRYLRGCLAVVVGADEDDGEDGPPAVLAGSGLEALSRVPRVTVVIPGRDERLAAALARSAPRRAPVSESLVGGSWS